MGEIPVPESAREGHRYGTWPMWKCDNCTEEHHMPGWRVDLRRADALACVRKHVHKHSLGGGDGQNCAYCTLIAARYIAQALDN